LEKARQQVDQRTVVWREGQQDFPMYYTVRERKVKSVMYSTVCKIIESLEKELGSLIQVIDFLYNDIKSG
jgi:actin-like ATPase involved in cell morphogenesis